MVVTSALGEEGITAMYWDSSGSSLSSKFSTYLGVKSALRRKRGFLEGEYPKLLGELS